MSYEQVMVEGKGGISAKIVLDSVSEVSSSRMVTYEIECHRYIWAEMLTHKMLSRNAASSRAIPVAKMFEQCKASPTHWGKNQAGMQAGGELIGESFEEAQAAWEFAQFDAVRYAKRLLEAGLHKQHANRLTEPFQMMKAVISATEWDNFFWLRKHSAAQPEIEELARCMYEARQQSVPQKLKAGEWHLPYIETLKSVDCTETVYYLSESHIGTSGHVQLEDAIKVSAARCAAVSFRNNDYGLEKCREVWERLVGDERKHSSACEHQAKVMQTTEFWQGFPAVSINLPEHPKTWEDGVSHVDRNGSLWSGNLKGFVQLRKLIDGECCHNYEEAVNK